MLTKDVDWLRLRWPSLECSYVKYLKEMNRSENYIYIE